MMKAYDHKKIEKKWQTEWEKKKIYHASNDIKKLKYYSLIEFPYPSGDGLHIGHPRSYTGMDIVSRKRRMEGYNVLYPIGWDAFGLPTENYAIKTGKDPRIVTKQNTDNFRRQLKSLGISFDWSREINTTDPKYYKWTQWIFLQFLKKGLAYKAKMAINWCPKDKTGLANEEVVNGCCERCGTLVEKREKEQWMLAITKYAERLYDDLEPLDYSSQIKLSQKNWIGKSEGAEIDFKISGFSHKEIRSYIMGVENITFDLQKIGVKIINIKKDNKYEVLIPQDKINLFEKLISEKLKPGFWNEYIGNQVVFIFKDKKGKIQRIAWSESEELKLLNMCIDYAKKDFKNIQDMLEGNSWYKGFVSDSIKVFTTRPDTIFGATYLVLAPEHELVQKLKSQISNWDEVENYVKKVKKETEIDRTAEGKTKTGVEIKGVKAINPATKEEIPIYIADYVLPQYGTGAIMAVPAHDERDFEFAKKYNLPIKKVVLPKSLLNVFRNAEDITMGVKSELRIESDCYTGEGELTNSGKFNGVDSVEIKKEIIKFVGGKEKTTFKLRDWVFSRQRYWGEPIPVIHCEKCGIVPVPDKDLPVELPKLTGKMKNYQPTDSGESPLANITKWVNVKCPKCKSKGKSKAKRETDTMPNWAGSSWYYLRYTDPKNAKAFADKKNLKYWTPVDWYNGGNEHTTLHLLYSRFWHKFLFDLGLVPTTEPYKKRTSHGMILGEGGVKMSKSLGNVINPDEIVKIYGADTLRVYEMFMGPFHQSVAWSTESIIGSRRFLEKVWRIGMSVISQQKISSRVTHSEIQNRTLATQKSSIEKLLHKTIKKVGEDIESMSFNTAISTMMILATEMDNAPIVGKEEYKKFLQILAPFAPHITDELWAMFGEKKSINISTWPRYDENIIKEDEFKIVIQVNGKVRAEIIISAKEDEEEIRQKVLKNETILKFIRDVKIKKTIYIKNRLFNIVV